MCQLVMKIMLSRVNYMYIGSIMLAECGSELHHKYHNSTAGLTVVMVMDGSLITLSLIRSSGHGGMTELFI